MPTFQKPRPEPESEGAGRRLDGWKEVAAHLGRSERTVKRWETERGLPTRRVPGKGRPSVYAYAEDLDEWLKASHDLEPETAIEEAEPDPVPAEPAAAATVPFEPGIHASAITGSWIAIVPRWLIALSILVVGIVLLQAARPRLAPVLASLPISSHPPHTSQSVHVSDNDKAIARDLYLSGRYLWNQRTADSLTRALDDFTQAILHDPGYAPAYAGLADTYDLLPEYTTVNDRDAYQHAAAAARKAVDLDDSLAEAHRALAFAKMYGDWDFSGSEKEFRRAIDLNPKDPLAHKWYANAFGVPGRFAECLEQINKAQELDPYSHSILADKGLLLYNAGRTEEAVELLKEVERSSPDFRSPHYYLMEIYLNQGNYPLFLDEGEKSAEVMNDPALKDTIAFARIGYAREGRRGLLNNLYLRQREYYAKGKLQATLLAKTCVHMGKKQEALQLLEEAYSRHQSFLFACLSHPDLLTLKDEPRYKALVQKINFPAPSNTQSPSLIANTATQTLLPAFTPN
jgi:tetratricopeptide (TPR) repeat protein